MTAASPRRPWWKRKRTWALGATWLTAAWFLSAGPAAYCMERGWLPLDVYGAVYWEALRALPIENDGMFGHPNYVMWWVRLAYKHEGAFEPAASE